MCEGNRANPRRCRAGIPLAKQDSVRIGIALCQTALLCVALCGCPSLEEAQPFPDLDREAFRCEVEPVLVGALQHVRLSRQRPASVSRVRGQSAAPESGAQPRKRLHPEPAVDRARAHRQLGDGARLCRCRRSFGVPVVAQAARCRSRRLLSSGGTLFGNKDVFVSAADAGFEAIESWLAGGTRRDDCEPREEVGR